jgi:hypothetical protein
MNHIFIILINEWEYDAIDTVAFFVDQQHTL